MQFWPKTVECSLPRPNNKIILKELVSVFRHGLCLSTVSEMGELFAFDLPSTSRYKMCVKYVHAPNKEAVPYDVRGLSVSECLPDSCTLSSEIFIGHINF